jgi:uncharacterized protein YggE
MSQRILTTLGVVAAGLMLAVLAGLVGVLYTRPVTAQTTGVTGMRQITVVGQSEVKGQPDTATVQIGVETEAASAQEALAQNTTQTQAVQAKLKELGIDVKDIHTSNFSISPTYDYSSNKPRLTGYHVSNSVTVTIHDLGKAGTLLDQVVQVGANSISGISFSIADQEQLLKAAREAAIKDARARADQLAQSTGASVGEALVITENIGSASPIPTPAALARDTAALSAPVPIQPGSQSLGVSVQVTFALR